MRKSLKKYLAGNKNVRTFATANREKTIASKVEGAASKD
jgi:hypothetical protein